MKTVTPCMRHSFVGPFLVMMILLIGGSASALAAERMAVKNDSANIRSGPGTQHDLLWQIEKYHPIMVLEKKEGWYRFEDFEGDQGWIHAALVDTTRTVIIQVPRCNVRTGPGTQFAIGFNSDKGIPFKVLQVKGQWLEVQHADGDKGWLAENLVW